MVIARSERARERERKRLSPREGIPRLDATREFPRGPNPLPLGLVLDRPLGGTPVPLSPEVSKSFKKGCSWRLLPWKRGP